MLAGNSYYYWAFGQSLVGGVNNVKQCLTCINIVKEEIKRYAAIITDRFRIHNSEQFKKLFQKLLETLMYLGIGRPQAFATATRGDARTDNEGSDTSPLTRC